MPRGFGFIEMKSEEAKQRLLQEIGGSVKILGRVVLVKDAIANSHKKEQKEDQVTLAINGLPPETTEADVLKVVTSSLPNLNETPKILFNKNKRDFCFVVFQNPENAKKLLNRQLKIKERNLMVTRSKKRFGPGREGDQGILGPRRKGPITSALSVNFKKSSAMETEKPPAKEEKELGNSDFKKFL